MLVEFNGQLRAMQFSMNSVPSIYFTLYSRYGCGLVSLISY